MKTTWEACEKEQQSTGGEIPSEQPQQ